MTFSEIFSKSVKYPLNDYVKFITVGVLSLLVSLPAIAPQLGIENFIIISILGIISLIVGIIIDGYAVSVIKKGIENSSEIPGIDIVSNFVDGIKVIVISIVYFIIPIIVFAILAFATGAVGATVDHFVASLGIIGIIAVILFLIFGILQVVALSRFADTGSLGHALSIGEVFDDAKKIGLIKILLFLIIVAIISAIAIFIISIIGLIPYVGVIISSILIGGFLLLFYNYALGLLYSEV